MAHYIFMSNPLFKLVIHGQEEDGAAAANANVKVAANGQVKGASLAGGEKDPTNSVFQ